MIVSHVMGQNVSDREVTFPKLTQTYHGQLRVRSVGCCCHGVAEEFPGSNVNFIENHGNTENL